MLERSIAIDGCESAANATNRECCLAIEAADCGHRVMVAHAPMSSRAGFHGFRVLNAPRSGGTGG